MGEQLYCAEESYLTMMQPRENAPLAWWERVRKLVRDWWRGIRIARRKLMNDETIELWLNEIPPSDNLRFVGKRRVLSPRAREYYEYLTKVWTDMHLRKIRGWVLVRVIIIWPDRRRRDPANLDRGGIPGRGEGGEGIRREPGQELRRGADDPPGHWPGGRAVPVAGARGADEDPDGRAAVMRTPGEALVAALEGEYFQFHSLDEVQIDALKAGVDGMVDKLVHAERARALLRIAKWIYDARPPSVAAVVGAIKAEGKAEEKLGDDATLPDPFAAPSPQEVGEMMRVYSADAVAEADKAGYERGVREGREYVRVAPRIVCLCGSTRFMEAYQEANLRETLAGKIVLSVGCNTKDDRMLGLSPEVKLSLDDLHKRKIDLADEVLVLNVGGYIGESTRGEIEYANRWGKVVRYLDEAAAVEGKS